MRQTPSAREDNEGRLLTLGATVGYERQCPWTTPSPQTSP